MDLLYLLIIGLVASPFLILLEEGAENFRDFRWSDSSNLDKARFIMVTLFVVMVNFGFVISVNEFLVKGGFKSLGYALLVITILILYAVPSFLYISRSLNKRTTSIIVGISIIVSTLLVAFLFYNNEARENVTYLDSISGVSVETVKKQISQTFVENTLEVDGINAFFSYTKNDENYNLEIDTEYKTVNEEFYGEVNSYGLGDYHISDSKVTVTLLDAINQMINGFLNEVLEDGEEIIVSLYGFTDSNKYSEGSVYEGIDGNFPKGQDDYDFKIYNYFYNGELVKIRLKKGDQMTNQVLGFLRAFCMYDENLRYNAYLSEKKRKTKYIFHSVSNEDDKGGGYRKVGVNIKIINVSPEYVLPSPDPPTPDTFCDRIVYLILALLGISVGFVIHFGKQYGKFQEKRDENEKKYYLKRLWFWLFITVICIVLVFVKCPEFLAKII